MCILNISLYSRGENEEQILRLKLLKLDLYTDDYGSNSDKDLTHVIPVSALRPLPPTPHEQGQWRRHEW